MPTGTWGTATDPAVIGSLPRSVIHCRRELQLDHQTRGFTALEGQPAGGEALITLPVPQADQHYAVEKVFVTSDSTNAWTSALVLGEPSEQANWLDSGSGEGTYDEAAGAGGGILVPSGVPFGVFFQGLSAGAVCRARIQWAVRIALSVPMAR